MSSGSQVARNLHVDAIFQGYRPNQAHTYMALGTTVVVLCQNAYYVVRWRRRVG